MTEEVTVAETKVQELSKQEQVKNLIMKGGYTRETIAKELGMSVASVSSQFTYLRWRGNFIIFDDAKVLSLVTEEEFNAWKAAKDAKAGTKKTAAASTKTPAEQYKALAKQIGTEKKQLEAWKAKLTTIEKDLAAMPNDVELLEMQAEAGAMIVLLGIKVNRNERKLATMPEPEEAPVDDENPLPEDDGTDVNVEPDNTGYDKGEEVTGDDIGDDETGEDII